MSPKNYVKLTNYLWFVYIIVICILIISCHAIHFASKEYFEAAMNWKVGKPIYTIEHFNYFYFPQTAILYTLLIKLPAIFYEVSWRIFILGLLWYGVYRFSKLNPYGEAPFFFFVISLVTMLLGTDAAVLGQLNIMAAGIMLIATATILDEQWWRTAFYLVIGFALCPVVFIMFLLARTVYKKLLFRMIFLFILSLIIPFMFQQAHYVFSQYALMHKVLIPIDTINLTSPKLFSLIAHFGLIIPLELQTILGFIFGILLFAFCVQMKENFAKPQFCVFLFTIAAIFLMLINPHALLSDYVILAPSLGFMLTIAVLKQQLWLGILYGAIIIGVIIEMFLGFIMDPAMISWIAPLMVLIFSCIFLANMRYCLNPSSKFI